MTSTNRQQHFQRVTRPWCSRLYAISLRQASTPCVAEDWLQETLLRAWRDFNQLAESVAVYAWLLKILDHVIADDVRRELRRHQLAPVITVDDQDLIIHPCSAPGPFENLLQQQMNEQISTAVENLPEEFRRVVLLREIEGLSYSDIGYVLDIPTGTVMSRLSRGRRILANSLIKLKGTETSTRQPIKHDGIT